MTEVPSTIDGSHLSRKKFFLKEKMSDLLNRPFYDLNLDRDLDFEINRFGDNHFEITSFPQEVHVPASEVAITTLYVSKELPTLPEFFHITWVVNDQVITQVFGTEAGCFEEKDRFIITCRFEPKTLQLPGLKMKDLFRHTPRITPYRRSGKDVVILETPKKVKIRFHFKRIMSTLDYLWEGMTTYFPAYLGLISALTEQHP